MKTNNEMFRSYLKSFDKTNSISLESSLHNDSFDSDKNTFSYNELSELSTIPLDVFCDRIYRGLYFSDDLLDKMTSKYGIKPCELNLASVDSFFIDNQGNCYLIEFKNSSISKVKESVTKKAYQSFFLLCDLFYRKRGQMDVPSFEYDNPIDFVRNKVTFILVVNKDGDSRDYEKIHLASLANERFRTPYLERIRQYLFLDAFAITSDLFSVFCSNHISS